MFLLSNIINIIIINCINDIYIMMLNIYIYIIIKFFNINFFLFIILYLRK